MARSLVVFAALGLLVGVAPLDAQNRSGPATVRSVRVAAASDLRFALDELVAELRARRPDLDVTTTYGSSGTFFAQLVNGAPFDVFMSADVDYPRQLTARGLTVPESAFIYGVGQLVLWSPAGSPVNPANDGWNAVTDRRVAHVSMANPATAPYGRAAEAALRRAGLYERVKGKLVLGETVSQAFQFAQSGAAQVGLVALSLALAPTVAGQGRYWLVPAESYPRLEQGGVILKSATDIGAARDVVAFLTSESGRGILRRFGFVVPGR